MTTNHNHYTVLTALDKKYMYVLQRSLIQVYAEKTSIIYSYIIINIMTFLL
jgi:hypothetical protein